MSLRSVSEKLGQQNDLLLEIGTDIYGYLDTVIARSELTSTRLDNLNSTNLQILQTIEAEQQPSGDDLEAKRDQQVVNERMINLMQQIATNTGGDGGGAEGKGGGVFSAALAGGLGFMAKGVGAGAALAGLGAGIGAFFAGIATADAIGAMMKADGSTIKKQIINLSEAFSQASPDGLAIMGGLIAGAGIFGAFSKIGTSAKAAVGMTALGAGIGGFFIGLSANDGLSKMMGADGANLKSIMVNLSEGLAALDIEQLTGLGALLGTGAIFGIVPGGLKIAGKVALGMTLIGAGIGGFFAGIAAAGDKALDLMGSDGSSMKTFMTNVSEGMSTLAAPNYENLLSFKEAAEAVSSGIGSLFFANAKDTLSGVLDNLGSLLGGEGGRSIYEKISEGLKSLEGISYTSIKQLDPAADTVNKMSQALTGLSGKKLDFSLAKKELNELGELMSLSLPMFNAMYAGGTAKSPDGQVLTFNPGLQNIPNETFAKINSVLSVNSASQQSAPTSSNTMSTLIRENNETKNSAPVVIMDNSQNSNVSGGGGGSSIITGNYSPFDTYDPYLVTRR